MVDSGNWQHYCTSDVLFPKLGNKSFGWFHLSKKKDAKYFIINYALFLNTFALTYIISCEFSFNFFVNVFFCESNVPL